MEKIKESEIVKSRVVDLRYIFGITKNSDGSIAEVIYDYKNNDNELCWHNEKVSDFAKEIIEGNIVAYCGQRTLEKGEYVFNKLVIVTPCVTEESIILKTASDTETINNLQSLPVYEIKKDSNNKSIYKPLSK